MIIFTSLPHCTICIGKTWRNFTKWIVQGFYKINGLTFLQWLESDLPKISLLTSILLLFDVVVFLAITLNVEILHQWIDSWKDLLIFYKFIRFFFSHSIYDKWNSKASLFNDIPELKQTNSSFSRSTSKGFMFSFINVFITACTSSSVLRICDRKQTL